MTGGGRLSRNRWHWERSCNLSSFTPDSCFPMPVAGLFYVGARGTWYPNRGIAMANYDITFRFPQSWTLVATGKQVFTRARRHAIGRALGQRRSNSYRRLQSWTLRAQHRQRRERSGRLLCDARCRKRDAETVTRRWLCRPRGRRWRRRVPATPSRGLAAPTPVVDGVPLAARAADTHHFAGEDVRPISLQLARAHPTSGYG